MEQKIDIHNLSNDYKNGYGLDYICKTYKIGKLKAKKIITSQGIIIRKKGSSIKKRNFKIDDWKIKKYKPVEGFHYIAKSKIDGTEFNDYENNGGYLTSYIKKTLNIEIPSLYDRRIYYQETGNYWWEQWFDIILIRDKETKKCPYCKWETCDIDNKSGYFQTHLKEKHNLSIEEHIENFPQDLEYFKNYNKKINKEKKLKIEGNYVICPICGNKYEKLTQSHILSHNMTMEEFRNKYPQQEILSNTMLKQILDAVKLTNLTTPKSRFISKYEKELQDFLLNHNVNFTTNRQILIGKEIDILIEDKKIGIEFDGLKWHTEWFGKKNHAYHLEKTKLCNQKGYGLIHIFEDEYVNNKEIVLHKLSHILGLDYECPKIMARKCEIKEIYKHDAENFLNTYHIQGFVSASVYVGAFYDNQLIAVMSFKNGNIKNPDWELVRFASNYNYVCQGIGSKIFKYFVNKYKPYKIVSFADRRWTINENNNLYIKLGFRFDKYTAPDYKYYSAKNTDLKYKRIHKMSFNKQKLHKKYGFPLTMTETEMAKELGYDRIWDCGLIKYIWCND